MFSGGIPRSSLRKKRQRIAPTGPLTDVPLHRLLRTTKQPRPIDRHGPLRVFPEGFRDAFGNPVCLRGVSLFWSCWADKFYTANTIHRLARDWNIDLVRLPFASNGPGPAGDHEFELAQQAITAAISCGIYILVDWHSPEPCTEAAIRFFSTIAHTYGDCPNIMYESWNEPSNTSCWQLTILPHHEQVIAATRRFAPNSCFIVGTPDLCKAVDICLARPVRAENVAYSIHFYAGTHREGLRNRMRRATSAGLPLFVSEWGASEASGGGIVDLAEATRWLNFLTQHNIGHVNWSFNSKEESCSSLRPGARPEGPWHSWNLTRSGRYVRRYLRAGPAK